MLLILLFLCFIIVPISNGSPVDKIEVNTNSTTLVHNKVQHNAINTKKIAIASEGGAILSNTPIQSLPKENQALLMTSAADISSNKVKARKGAFLEESRNISSEQISETSNSSSSSSQPPITKGKPPIVSVEAIAQSDLLNNDPAVDDIDERMVKIHKINSNGHPGMIMPIVITVLVVPMFAVIGYMALKRGQDAWKNRHYKRMDFLLDGMYND